MRYKHMDMRLLIYSYTLHILINGYILYTFIWDYRWDCSLNKTVLFCSAASTQTASPSYTEKADQPPQLPISMDPILGEYLVPCVFICRRRHVIFIFTCGSWHYNQWPEYTRLWNMVSKPYEQLAMRFLRFWTILSWMMVLIEMAKSFLVTANSGLNRGSAENQLQCKAAAQCVIVV